MWAEQTHTSIESLDLCPKTLEKWGEEFLTGWSITL